MKRFQVVGIGNAMVDVLAEASDGFLAENGIEKGIMQLIDSDRAVELYGRVGPAREISGGSAANTIAAIALLGGQTAYVGKVKDDQLGAIFAHDLRAQGAVYETTMAPSGDKDETGRCIVLVTPDGERSMNTYLGVTVNLAETEVSPEAIANSKFVYMEGYLVASPTGKAAAIKAASIAREAGIPTVLTLSDPNMVNFFGDGLLEMAGDNLDLLFCNEDEGMLMTKTDNVEAAAEALKKLARRFAITVGDKGAVVYDGESLHRIPTEKVEVIDTNGAGDMFAGAFLYGLTHGMDFVQSAELACRAGSKIVTHFGPRLPAEQTKALLA